MKNESLLNIERKHLLKSRVVGTDTHRQQTNELIVLAYTFAKYDGRDSLIEIRYENGFVAIGDWDLALLVNDGQFSAITENDWWRLKLIA